ncbi:DUF742 domain-containing protein [Streptomyces sp. KL116D]|uniref:DUF742 domain-containing protein n=1 Tax=Streptomyces sp. KL116D TaxID=3045152 RepID=UPI00355834BF
MTEDPRPGPAGPPEHYDDAAGPLVRLYAMTRGRARPATAERFDLMTAVHPVPTYRDDPPLPPEQRALLTRCRHAPAPVADLASDTGLPLGVVRVLLGDLLTAGLIRVTAPATTRPGPHRPSPAVLQEVIHGLRAL